MAAGYATLDNRPTTVNELYSQEPIPMPAPVPSQMPTPTPTPVVTPTLALGLDGIGQRWLRRWD